MTVTFSSTAIELEGVCPDEDAELILQHLLAAPTAVVDWRACQSAHAAVIQVLMAAKPRMVGPPTGSVLKKWIEPLLMRVAP